MAIRGREIVSLIKRQIEEFGADLTLVDVGTVVQVGDGIASIQGLQGVRSNELIQKEVVVSTEVDEAILGGVIIQVGDQLLDGSVRSRLEGLRRQVRSDVIATAA